jgi:hypothetical protein
MQKYCFKLDHEHFLPQLLFYFEGLGEHESFGTAASNGPIITALEDRSVWIVGGVITGRVKSKCTEKYLLLYHVIH